LLAQLVQQRLNLGIGLLHLGRVAEGQGRQLGVELGQGFYFGAMYVSFGFAVGIFLACGVILYYLANDPELWVYVTTVAVVTLISTPMVFRYSRALMLYLFGGARYDANWAARRRH
jgi:hypothetical protein